MTDAANKDNKNLSRSAEMNRRIPFITIIIGLMNLFGMIYGFQVGEDIAASQFGMYQGALENGEWLRLLICGFLHFGLSHLGSNMLCLIMFGISFECDMGHVKYLSIYISGLIGSGLLVNYIGGTDAVHAGASGAIWALMTATLVYTVRNHGNPIYVLRGIALNLVYSFSAGISWQGHLGGAIAGLLVASILFHDSYASPTSRLHKSQIENESVLRGIICTNCGQRLSETVARCPICGQRRFDDNTFIQNGVETMDVDNNHLSISSVVSMIICVIVIAVVIGGAFISIANSKTDKPMDTEKIVSVTSASSRKTEGDVSNKGSSENDIVPDHKSDDKMTDSNSSSDTIIEHNHVSDSINKQQTVGEQNAVRYAITVLDYVAVSYNGMAELLEYMGYSETEAKYGADNCGADWFNEAKEKAEEYLKYSPFSKQGLIDQLEYDGFTREQAEYGVKSLGFE